jgi:hypothetical protein
MHDSKSAVAEIYSQTILDNDNVHIVILYPYRIYNYSNGVYSVFTKMATYICCPPDFGGHLYVYSTLINTGYIFPAARLQKP